MNAATVTLRTLDLLANALMNDDFDLYEKHMLLPLTLITDSANLCVATSDDLEEGFDAFLSSLQAKGVMGITHVLETARYSATDEVEGAYVMHFVSAGEPAVPPFRCRMTLCKVGEIWKASHMMVEIQNARWPIMISHTEGP
jgi:hypothetical protein